METNLKVKYIPPKMTQEELYSLFSSIGEVESCKLIKNKITGQSEGYGFIIYHQAEDAKKAINKFNGFKVLQETLRVSYARSTTESFNKLGLKQYHNVDNSKTNLIVNYIPDSMTQEEFQLLFSGIGEIVHCKLIIDKVTGQSESYGFVTYSLPEDAEKAINILNGLKVLNKSLKVSYARPSSNLIKGANLYVTKLPRSMTQKDLEELFSPFGRIVSCRLLCDNMSIRQFVPGAEKNTPGISRGTAFVRFDQRIEAENAVQALNGALINGNNIPLIVRFAKRDNPQFPLYYSSQVTFTQEVFRSWNIYIAGLSPVAKENILWSLFGQYGAIQSVKVVRCRQSHYCRGFGYVRMANFNEALMAVQCLNGYFLDNQPLQVRFKIDRISGFHQQHYEAERSASWGYCQSKRFLY